MKVVETRLGKIRYFEKGSENKKTILFIHGLGVSPWTYKEAIEALSTDFRVVAPYIQGVSDLKNSSDFLAVLLEELQISSVIPLGHSSSGVIATGFAYYYPKKTKALILIDTVGIPINRSFLTWVVIWSRHVISLLVGPFRNSGGFIFKLFTDFTFHILFYPKLLAKEMWFTLHFDMSSLIAKIDVPILVLRGKDDIIIPKEVGEKIIELNKKAVFKEMPGGHNWAKTEVKALAREVEEFVKAIS